MNGLGYYGGMRGMYGDRPAPVDIATDQGINPVFQGMAFAQQQRDQQQQLQARQFALQQAQQGADNQQQFNQLASQAYSTQPDQRNTLLGKMAALNPQEAERQALVFGQMDKAAQDRHAAALTGLAQKFTAIAQDPDPQRQQAEYSALLQQAKASGKDVSMFENVPPAVGAKMAVAQIADAKSMLAANGMGPDGSAKVVGNALVDPRTGKVLYQGEAKSPWKLDSSSGVLVNPQTGQYRPVMPEGAQDEPGLNTSVQGANGHAVQFNFPPGTPPEVIAAAKADAVAHGDIAPGTQVGAQSGPLTLAQYKAQNSKKGNSSDVIAPPPADASLQGQAYIDALPDNIRENAVLLAEGKAPWPTGYVLKSAYGQQLVAAARHINPNVDATSFPSRTATSKSAAAGPLGNSTNAFNTALQHAEALVDANQQMDISNLPLIGSLDAETKNLERNNAYNTFMAGRMPFASEMARAYKGGAPAEGEIDKYYAMLDPSAGKKAIAQRLQTYTDFLYSKALANARQYQQGMRQAGMPYAPLPQETLDAIRQSRAIALKAGVPQTRLDQEAEKIGVNAIAGSDAQSGPQQAPSTSDIAYLRSHPNMATQFDAHFGAGSAEKALGQ